MHLMQDMSVPEHTRDTAHILNYTIENFVEKIASNGKNPYWPRFNSLISPPFSSVDPTLLQQTSHFLNAPVPIVNLFDMEKYGGTDPSVTLNNSIGLAEYSNANFFSFNTIFTDAPHPAHSNVMEYNETDPITKEIKTFVASEEADHLAQTIVFNKYLVFGKTKGYTLEDDRIYLDYMQKLLPRAAGYSAALLDYFFRGRIKITTNQGDITFRSVKVRAQNDTAGESMGSGEGRLVIRYKELSELPLGGNKSQLNYPPDGTNISDYTYKVSAPLNVDLTTSQELTFDFSNDPLPFFFGDISMQLVFKGKLGNEEGAVAASPLTSIDGIYTDFALSLPSTGIYAKTADSTLGSTFNELKVTAQADITGGLSGGSFTLALEYRETEDDPFQSLPVGTEPANAMTYVIRVAEKNGVNTLPLGTPVELVFDLSQVPLSVRSTDLHLNVIYTDPATSKPLAIGYRDISEPTPVDIFNNTDFVCINNQWYPAGDPATIVLADQLGNRNDIDDDTDTFRHDFTNIYYKLTSTVNPTTASAGDYTLFESGPVAPATFKRLGFVLTDYTLQYSSMRDLVLIDPNDGWTGGTGTIATPETGMGVRNQADTDGNYTYSPMYNMRGKPMWGGAGTVYGNAKLPASSICDWAQLPAVP